MDSLEPIKRKIYEIRGRRVMLDSDLAEMYQVETKNLKRAVRANIERFPDDFMFELTKEEYDSLRCNNFTLNNVGDSLRCKNFTSNKRGGNRYLPFVFTREGIAMLSGLLRSDIIPQVFLCARCHREAQTTASSAGKKKNKKFFVFSS